MTLLRRQLARVVLLLALAISLPALHEVTATSAGRWTQQVVPGPVAYDLRVSEIRCPTTTVCYALRSSEQGPGAPHPVLQITTDGGATWTAQQVDASLPDTFFPAHLACPSVDRCYMLVNTAPLGKQAKLAIRVTSDGGKTWKDRPIGITGELDQISCPSVNVCYVSAFVYASSPSGVRLDLLSTRDSGRTWSTTEVAISSQPLFSLVCPGADDCYLAGYVHSTSQPATKGMRGLAATHDGGRTWTVHAAASPRSPSYFSLTCPSVLRCYAFGDAGLAVTTDGGKTWKKLPARNLGVGPADVNTTLVCAAALVCYIAQGNLWRTVDGGVTWSMVSSPSAFGLQSLACPGPSLCFAANSYNVLVKTTDGRTWQEVTPRPLRLDGIACPGLTTCIAVGFGGAVLTTNGGGIWVRHATGTPAALVSAACADTVTCLAGGFLPDATVGRPGPGTPILLRTGDGGQTWQTVNPPKGAVFGGALTCPSSSICYDAGDLPGKTPTPVVLRSGDGGRTWTQGEPLPTGYFLTSLACATVVRCAGVGGIGPCIDDLVRRTDAVGRAGGNACRERGWLFDTVDGSHWRREINRTLKPYALLGADLLTVSCPAPTQCYAGGFGLWVRGAPGGKTWVTRSTRFPGYVQPPERVAQPTDFIQSLSCPQPSTCWGIAIRVNSFTGVPVLTTDGGSHWQVVGANIPVPTDYGQGLTALACPDPTTCVGVGGDLITAYSP